LSNYSRLFLNIAKEHFKPIKKYKKANLSGELSFFVFQKKKKQAGAKLRLKLACLLRMS
jgi:hypothetical protein